MSTAAPVFVTLGSYGADLVRSRQAGGRAS